VIGAITIPAKAANAPPRPQLTAAMKLGELPSAAAERWFSATAPVRRSDEFACTGRQARPFNRR